MSRLFFFKDKLINYSNMYTTTIQLEKALERIFGEDPASVTSNCLQYLQTLWSSSNKLEQYIRCPMPQFWTSDFECVQSGVTFATAKIGP